MLYALNLAITLRMDTLRWISKGEEWFIFGRRATGFFDLRKIDGTKLNKGSYSYKRIKLITNLNSLLIERRMAIPPTTEEAGILAKIL